MVAFAHALSDLYIGPVEGTQFKCLERFYWDFEGKSSEIRGPTRLGKTSVLDAIAWNLGLYGKKELPDLIRDGEIKATTKVTLVDRDGEPQYHVVRTKTAKKDDIEVTAADGSTPDECDPPAKWLDSLLDKFCYNLLDFLNMTAQQQRDFILRLKGIGPPVDEVEHIVGERFEAEPDENAAMYMSRLSADKIGLFYVQRTNLGRIYEQKKKAHAEAKERWAQLGGVEGEEEETTTDINRQIEAKRRVQDGYKALQRQAEKSRDEHTAGKRKATDLATAVTIADKRVEDLRRQLAEAEEAAAKARRNATKWDEWVHGLEAKARDDLVECQKATDPAPDIAALSEQLRTIDARNKVIRNRLAAASEEKRLDHEKDLAGEDVAEADLKLTKLRTCRANLLNDLDLGVPGLAIGEGEVLLNGHSFKGGASTSEGIEVCFALMSQHFERRAADGLRSIRMIRVDRAESLDDEPTAQILRLAEKHDIQAIFTRVAKTEGRKMVIENFAENAA
jgi:hypothetical protein